ncbi:DUF1178 family protein [Thauera linaloolentis]|uniref:DUF1178 domain-containing protein n=1 Tax=Thauera linaloolentis (strain DSM 12138 / JCM 21573 / CCUG 41526 / CIP 105981 / IAM 15112 / NBRC 102519 / 47Lol) TaxID=1123367 RepID=N6XVB3_THAL4|nr:DUF1178 family protein [Thauera linaloolentis]ENO85706.1 hypothetical protein C666_14840 [Thauera linaloolentis 47Lol = DSM 12138]MCM8566671.1 DUF1178 family protein [Thauera linaloolentis]
MIVLDLCCNLDHRFEGWFASADAFEEQCVRKLVSCPACGTTSVRRLPSAPYVQTRHAVPDASSSVTGPAVPAPAVLEADAIEPPAAANMLQMLRHMSRNAENVGDRLPEEARRIHYGEAEVRDIRGKASAEDVEELLDEGILILPLPPGEDEVH